MKKNHRIAFIFINEIHHINHFVTVAIELSKNQNVSILTYPGKHEYLRSKLRELGGKSVKVEELSTHWFRALTDRLKKRPLPRNNFWFKKNSGYIIKNFDAVIFTGFTHQNFLKMKKGAFPKLIKISHGIAGFDHGYYKYFADFDFALIFGGFDLTIFKEKNVLKEYAMMGYPKLDALKNIEKLKLFNNTKQTVIYCPHFSPKETSWNTFGLKVLEYFEKQDEYNLIFAPHINLFNRKGGEDISTIPQKYFDSNKIYIDLGGVKSVEMAYINAADIYLGDISSQVFEFIINPRPCIFINPNKVDFKDNNHYRFWQCGDVISDMAELDGALRNSEEKFDEKYRAIQQKINSENFYTEEGSTASERAAKAIIKFLDDNR